MLFRMKRNGHKKNGKLFTPKKLHLLADFFGLPRQKFAIIFNFELKYLLSVD
jgi:hypothetical protein